jgi:hypothetical protein
MGACHGPARDPSQPRDGPRRLLRVQEEGCQWLMEGDGHMSPPVLFAGLLAAAHVATEERLTVADNPSDAPAQSLHAAKCGPFSSLPPLVLCDVPQHAGCATRRTGQMCSL